MQEFNEKIINSTQKSDIERFDITQFKLLHFNKLLVKVMKRLSAPSSKYNIN